MIYALTILGVFALSTYSDADSCEAAKRWLQPASELELVCKPAVES